MNKKQFLKQIVDTLEKDLAILTGAAKAAHAAATHEECTPDNKYDTTALEASYIAQGQANRAADIRQSLESYRNLELRHFSDETPVRLGALVLLEDEDGLERRIFIGPNAGGLKLTWEEQEWVVVTPEAPLGKALLGKLADDEIVITHRRTRKHYTLVEVR